MKKVLLVLLFYLLCSCGGVSPLRATIQETAEAVKVADGALTFIISMEEPKIADEVRAACGMASECVKQYQTRMEPFTYASIALEGVRRSLTALEASLDLYEAASAGNQAQRFETVVKNARVVLSDLGSLISLLQGAGVTIPPQLGDVYASLDKILREASHGR